MYICGLIFKLNYYIIKIQFMKEKIEAFLDLVKERNGNEPEFLQAVEEVAETVIPYIVKHDIYNGKNILLRMVEPERVIIFSSLLG